jgi:autotransporter-associated beta strand protein
VPTLNDTAYFGQSTVTDIDISFSPAVAQWSFSAGSPRYSFTLFGSLTFTGAGILDNATGPSAIDNWSQLVFKNTSSAGYAGINNEVSSFTEFTDFSSAYGAIIQNGRGLLTFNSHSTAAKALIYNDSLMTFQDQSTASTSYIQNDAKLIFIDMSTAGSAYVETYAHATTLFEGTSNSGAALLNTHSGGTVDFSLSAGPAGNHHLTVGAIGGGGAYLLGGDVLTVGEPNAESPSFPSLSKMSGAIEDGGAGGGSGASLVKVGGGLLKLTHAHNTYSGGTILKHGALDLAAVGAAGTGAITFAGHPTLKLENAALSDHVFHNAIDNFGNHDVLDLTGLQFDPDTSAIYHKATHHLAVSNGHVTDTLTLLSSHGTHFSAASDGHAGTEVFLLFT